jgi:hypothetical protein
MSKVLRVIENPDSLYPACTYTNTAAILHKPNMPGLPHQVNWKLGRLIGSECDTITSVPTVLVEEEKLVAQLFPNPASTEATLVLSKPSTHPLEFLLFDALGRKVLSERIIRHTKYLNIDLSDLPGGFYSYRIVGANKNPITGKLVISK